MRIPTSTFQALERFLFHGIPTGGFLRAVMENDLRGSFERADEENRANPFATLCFLVNAMPSITWGSAENIDAWLSGESHVLHDNAWWNDDEEQRWREMFDRYEFMNW